MDKNYKMKYVQNALKGFISIIALTMFLSGCVHIKIDHNPGDQKLDKILSKTFTTVPGKKLEVSTSVGDVTLNSWNKDEVQVTINGSAKAKERLEFNVDSKDSGVIVEIKRKGSWLKMFSNVRLSIDVNVPEHYNANVSTAGGDINVAKITGDFELETSGGDIKLINISGNSDISTSGGDIKIAEYYGKLDASTSGGDIKVANSQGDLDVSTSGGDVSIQSKDGEVKASTSGGDIKLDYSGINKGIELSTSGGSIGVIVDSDFGAEVKLSTLGGDVSCSLPTTIYEKKSSSLSGKINKGGKILDCSTLGGNIKVKGRE